MFIRPYYQRVNGTPRAYWALVESYRTAQGSRQRVVAYLGQAHEREREGVARTAQAQHGPRQAELFQHTQPDWVELSEGCYVLRSNIDDWTAEDLWRAYIQLTEAEAAFRIHKTDLRIRPIWHQREDRVQAHILVCFLAYVNTAKTDDIQFCNDI